MKKNRIDDRFPSGAADAATRDRVVRAILDHGPATARELAERLHLTPAAVRRHTSMLVDQGNLEVRPKYQPGPKKRGRPSSVFVLTDKGRGDFLQAYDQVAIKALRYLRETAGPEAVEHFAEQLVAGIESRFSRDGESKDVTQRLVKALSEEGYVASLGALPTGLQLCQNHCPVANVAAEFPELCAAETRAFSRMLGSHVQRLATIAHGDTVCTTHIPKPVTSEDNKTAKQS